MPGEFSPYLVATPLGTLMFAFYGRVMPFGALGYVSGALAGFVWSLVAGVVSSWLSQEATIAALNADAVLFACVIVAGSLVGGGVLYLLLFWSVLREPSTTYAVLSALMRPTVPFFIALNSAMEVLFVPLVVFLNWNTEARRRWIIVIAAGIYVVHRALDLPCLCRAAACHRYISTYRGRRRVVHAHTRDGLSRRVERNHFCPVHGSRVSKLNAALN